MTTERLVFGHVVEALYEYVLGGADMDAKLRQTLESQAISPERSQVAYPQEAWVRSVQLSAVAMYPGLTRGERERRVGERFIQSYDRTMVGGALMSLLKILGPRRTLDRMARNFKTGTNYIETKLTQITENEFTLWMNEIEALHAFTQGILVGALEIVGAKPVAVTIREAGADSCVFHIKW